MNEHAKTLLEDLTYMASRHGTRILVDLRDLLPERELCELLNIRAVPKARWLVFNLITGTYYAYHTLREAREMLRYDMINGTTHLIS